MSEIKHIVYLMLENRSVDQLLGWLYDEKHPPQVNIPTQVPAQTPPSFDGLKQHTYFNLDKNGEKHYVLKGTNNNMNVPIHDPHEKYSHINRQLFGSETNPACHTKPGMGGFYQDFASYNDHVEQIMQSYTPEELPVLNGLARNFGVSDRYFCSVPSQTNCNRAFAACGNSLGLNDKGQLEAWVNNGDFSFIPPHASQPESRLFNQKTMWNVLSENGKDQPSDWMIYYSQGSWWEDLLGLEGYSYTRDLMTQLHAKELDHHFDKMDEFFTRAKSGTLPSVCFLEPAWGLEFPVGDHDYGINGTDYHPPTNLLPGEAFVKKIYDALTFNKEAWAQTLWIINFDEHGGTYDHVDPPWGAQQPWASDGTPVPETSELGFAFDRFGVRVPLILVSPWVQKSTVFRAKGNTPYDHTSVIATILNLMGIPKDKWGLGGRTANAPCFENVFQGKPLRTDVPCIEVNSNAITSLVTASEIPVNDIQMRMAYSLLNRSIKRKGLSPESVKRLSLTPLVDAKTPAELTRILRASLEKVNSA